MSNNYPPIPPGGIGLDLSALRRTIEAALVKSMMNATGDKTTAVQKKQFNAVIDIFTRHGIGAVETMTILQELQEVLKGDS